MATGRRSWAPAWWVGGALLLVPLAALLWLEPATVPKGRGWALDSSALPLAETGDERAEVASQSSRAAPRRDPPAQRIEPPLADEVAGLVLDPDGRPVEHAVVSCAEPLSVDQPIRGVTGSDGRFALPTEAAGCMAVATHRRHGESAPVELKPTADNKLELRLGAAIEGVVVDGQGRPVDRYQIAIESYRPAGAPAAVKRRGDQARTGESQAVVDPGGAFAFEGLNAGHYVLAASAPGRPPVHSDGIDLAAAERQRHLRIQLDLGGALEGRIVDRETGDPIGGAQVALDGMTMTRVNTIAPTQSGPDGDYRLEGVPAKPFSVRVRAAGYRSQVVAGLRVASGQSQVLDLQLAGLGDAGADQTEYTGIGAVLRSTTAGVIIAATLDGGPAATAGVQRNDRIVGIDGRSTAGLSVAQCVQLLRGPEGSRVVMSLERDGQGELDVVLTRAHFVR